MHWPFAFKREHPNHFPEVIPKPKVSSNFFMSSDPYQTHQNFYKHCYSIKYIFFQIDYLTDISPVQTWLAMEELVTKGLVKHIGLSNFNSQQITEIMSAGSVSYKRIRLFINL